MGNLKMKVTGLKMQDAGDALTACGIKEQNPEFARNADYEDRVDEDGYDYRVKNELCYEQALEDTSPEEVKLVARCLLRHRARKVIND